MASPSITLVPASGSITAKVTVVRLDLADLPLNDATDYTEGVVPSRPEIRYYITFTLDSVELGRSPVFAPDFAGAWQFNNYIFPEAGTWTVEVIGDSDGLTKATASVVVA
jgi:hypothetical protein